MGALDCCKINNGNIPPTTADARKQRFAQMSLHCQATRASRPNVFCFLVASFFFFLLLPLFFVLLLCPGPMHTAQTTVPSACVVVAKLYYSFLYANCMINSLHKQLHALQNVQSPVFFARICFFFLQFSVFYFRVAVAAVFVALSTLQAKPARYSFGKKKKRKRKAWSGSGFYSCFNFIKRAHTRPSDNMVVRAKTLIRNC